SGLRAGTLLRRRRASAAGASLARLRAGPAGWRANSSAGGCEGAGGRKGSEELGLPPAVGGAGTGSAERKDIGGFDGDRRGPPLPCEPPLPRKPPSPCKPATPAGVRKLGTRGTLEGPSPPRGGWSATGTTAA